MYNGNVDYPKLDLPTHPSHKFTRSWGHLGLYFSLEGRKISLTHHQANETELQYKEREYILHLENILTKGRAS